MMIWLLFAILASLAVDIRADDECCDPALGCFSDSGDFKTFSTPYCIDVVDPKFAFFSRATRNEAQYMTRDSAIPAEFSADKRTIFIVHGWQNDVNTEFLHNTKDALLDREDANVIVVGWGGGASSVVYSWSAATTRVMGAEVALRMDRLKTKAGVDGSKIWCIGHSLGAHICGYAGSRTPIARITGLDPARQEFEEKAESVRLSPADAEFVDVIHTDAWGLTYFHYGIYEPSGDADFYPNKGYDQPNCYTKRGLDDDDEDDDDEDDLDDRALHEKRGVSCSHTRAHQLFLESVKNVTCFPVSQRCTDYEALPGSCTACTNCGVMGYNADQGGPPKGIFYLETTSEAPFCTA